MGALTLLTGCDISDDDSVQQALAVMSRFNDRVQAALFGANRLAPTFPEDQAVKDFRYNAWYPPEKPPASTPPTTACNSPDRSPTSAPGPWTVSTPCPKPARSPATSASKAGA